jgi:hypothetical protein
MNNNYRFEQSAIKGNIYGTRKESNENEIECIKKDPDLLKPAGFILKRIQLTEASRPPIDQTIS